MEFTLTIHTTSMMNGKEKNRGINKPEEREDTSIQRIVKNQLEVMEVENESLCNQRFSL